MSYETNLEKIEQDNIAELYQISSGLETFFFTSYIENVEFQSNEYKAVKIKRTTITNEPRVSPHRIKVTAPVTNPFSKYIANNTLDSVNIKIYRVFLFDSTFEIIFEGKAINSVSRLGAAEIDFESNSLIFRQKIGSIVHQAFCNNGLFDNRCALAANDFKVTAQITVSGNSLASTAFSSFADQYFQHGHIKTLYNDTRLITSHIGDTITLHVPFDSRLTTGSFVDAFPGCDKSPGACRNKFNNFENFLGFPFIPSNNPAIFGA